MPQGYAPSAPRAGDRFVDSTGALTEGAQSMLNELWRQLAAGYPVIPCQITGTNQLQLTPILHKEGATNYLDHLGFAGQASSTSTGSVTARVGSGNDNLDYLKVYASDGAAQAGAGALVANNFYLFFYVAALDSGNGGLVLK